ncbi:MAG: hypothetical protein P4L98_04150 [Ancalomicrobiaceae bacterium]|nr:hypothetical protein [Ancalomicrobiaceae bacterium]
MGGITTWLPLFALAYLAAVLYWARVAAVENGNHQSFFSAGHSLAPWISTLVIGGAALSGWFILGGATEIARTGFTLPAILQAGVVLALPGTILFKRLWYAGERLRLSSQAELFNAHYRSPALVAASVAVAVIFAVGFAGLQLRAVSVLVSDLADGAVSRAMAGLVLSLVLFGYVVIGGLRAVGYVGVLQTVLAAAGLAGLAAYALLDAGGVAALTARLAAFAADPASAGLFSVSGVIRFTAGLGRDETAVTPTALSSFGLAVALLGFQASPLALKLVLSTSSPRGLAAGQTWVAACVFGCLILVGVAILGGVGLVNPAKAPSALLTSLSTVSPWFGAWLVIGLVAGVQLVAGLALIVAGEGLVRHLYKPYFHSRLDRRATVVLARIVIALLALATVLMEALSPVALSALAGLALPLAAQLWTPLLGITWFGWISRPAAVLGVGFGFAAVLLTEPMGLQVLSFLGLDLPWGRWPWGLHSAVWGIAANIAAVLILSAIPRSTAQTSAAADLRRFFASRLAMPPRARALAAAAWSIGLVWVFLAVGPGLVFADVAFGRPGSGRGWLTGLPSIWAWTAALWMLGVGFVWFLAYRMDMAAPSHVAIAPYEPPRQLRPDQRETERARLRTAGITVAIFASLVILVALGFGHLAAR